MPCDIKNKSAWWCLEGWILFICTFMDFWCQCVAASFLCLCCCCRGMLESWKSFIFISRDNESCCYARTHLLKSSRGSVKWRVEFRDGGVSWWVVCTLHRQAGTAWTEMALLFSPELQTSPLPPLIPNVFRDEKFIMLDLVGLLLFIFNRNGIRLGFIVIHYTRHTSERNNKGRINKDR